MAGEDGRAETGKAQRNDQHTGDCVSGPAYEERRIVRSQMFRGGIDNRNGEHGGHHEPDPEGRPFRAGDVGRRSVAHGPPLLFAMPKKAIGAT